MVNVYFSNETPIDMSIYEPVLNDIIAESLNSLPISCPDLEIGVVFTDNQSIRELNLQFRNIDSSTDVLSFPMYSSWREWPIEGQTFAIGDIVISVEKARLQSELYGHSLTHELGFLTAHSMLHLAGYDHISLDEEKKMFGLQNIILKKVGLRR